MADKKRQHYLPKFYLRNFSTRQKAIVTYDITNSSYIPNASIRNMCKKDYFYGSDKKMENLLRVELEDVAAPIIKNILDTNTLPDIHDDDYEDLVIFLLVCEARNLKAADSRNKIFDFNLKMSPKIQEYF
jgi:hypothetical protein